MTEDQMFNAIDNLLTKTGSRFLDFDVEGSGIGMVAQNDLRNKVIRRLQTKYPKLYVSYTLAVQSAQYGALPDSALTMLKNAISNEVRVDEVNGMIMDL